MPHNWSTGLLTAGFLQVIIPVNVHGNLGDQGGLGGVRVIYKPLEVNLLIQQIFLLNATVQGLI